MTPRERQEMTGKCRRLFIATKAVHGMEVGQVIGVASGGGVLADLHGDDQIVAAFTGEEALDWVACVEEYFTPIPPARPMTFDLARLEACCAAVDAHRVVKQAEADFTEKCGAMCFGNADMTVPQLARSLKLKAYMPDEGVTTEMITEHQAKQVELRAACDAACCTLLAERDLAVTYQTRSVE